MIIVKSGKLKSEGGRAYEPGDHFGTPCLLAEVDREETIHVSGTEACVCIEVVGVWM